MTATTPNGKTVTAVTDINVLIIVGLHAASINSELSEAAADCSADGIALTTVGSLTDLPRYSETFEHRGTPSSVQGLRTAAAAADAVVIVTTYHDACRLW
ncbi:MAG: NAD(P)H-dependent oxidoreductase [Mycobacterium sp.]|uniref:NAD(P)H-dependent oxidoreductase n=1 Tax=Mycobacterium sp. TaxID=1785 RepID=UPI003899F424